MDKKRQRSELGIDETIPVVGFFGSMAPNKGPLVLEACRLLLAEFPGLRLLVAGRVSGVDIDQPWVAYRGELPQGKIPQLISACDVVVVPLDRHPQNNVSGSCKIAEYLACERPVVATKLADHERIFCSAPNALCDATPDSMAKAIRIQLVSPQVMPFPDGLAWSDIGKQLHSEIELLVSGADNKKVRRLFF